MAPAKITVETPYKNLVVEQALAFAKEMEATANHAVDGRVLDLCESLILSNGRDLLRTVVAGAAQQQASCFLSSRCSIRFLPFVNQRRKMLVT